MNNVSLLGRLTANPELKYTQTQTAYTRFSVAVDRAYTKQGEERLCQCYETERGDFTEE